MFPERHHISTVRRNAIVNAIACSVDTGLECCWCGSRKLRVSPIVIRRTVVPAWGGSQPSLGSSQNRILNSYAARFCTTVWGTTVIVIPTHMQFTEGVEIRCCLCDCCLSLSESWWAIPRICNAMWRIKINTYNSIPVSALRSRWRTVEKLSNRPRQYVW